MIGDTLAGFPARRVPGTAAGLCEGERGSATIWVIALMALVWLAAAAVLLYGAARLASHRAQAAADLGALAGAVHALAEPAAACRRARELVEANGALVTGCVVHSGVVDLQVAFSLSLPLAGERTAVAEARAGPR
ncbi:hypothetical protein Sru01_62080 [Sphaerisporangium rufum]|uniref:Putative Flp pilus-assembly TadG-like N-terminal domain-containing protein n=1 Tax=Sphaerisporangium rufum TaxID=1381558 RepID=A0A919RA49_9ACTN|nr:Rv3654c family TadE-like protein [Sphaerisporangium rufum]GII81226.1 hypothetical protein Sru01_62080 [Sphaerisporangium rufum]